jgi:AcrR family transcriptional regulator
MRKLRNGPLTREDWTAAALDAIARGGIDAVAVEPLATKLGATKGSFYWHFKNRAALIQAALDEWERRYTDAVIEELEPEADPADRLKKLFAMTSEMEPEHRAIEIALLAKPDHPVARRAVRRVTQRRIKYMAQQLERLGWDPSLALDRAVLMSYLFVGYLVTTHVAPRVGGGGSPQRYAQLIFETVVGPSASRVAHSQTGL